MQSRYERSFWEDASQEVVHSVDGLGRLFDLSLQATGDLTQQVHLLGGDRRGVGLFDDGEASHGMALGVVGGALGEVRLAIILVALGLADGDGHGPLESAEELLEIGGVLSGGGNFVKSGAGQILACLLWTSPAWKMAARDAWIGWNLQQRSRNLQYIVNNSRFLILPAVHVKGLASTILARSARQLPQDWRQHYGYSPVLLETLVDGSRFKGTCYRAANWIFLGNTAGGNRTDRLQRSVPRPPKLIFVLPLHRSAQQRLCLIQPSHPSPSVDE